MPCSGPGRRWLSGPMIPGTCIMSGSSPPRRGAHRRRINGSGPQRRAETRPAVRRPGHLPDPYLGVPIIAPVVVVVDQKIGGAVSSHGLAARPSLIAAARQKLRAAALIHALPRAVQIGAGDLGRPAN